MSLPETNAWDASAFPCRRLGAWAQAPIALS